MEDLNVDDREYLKSHGLDDQLVEQQLALLRGPKPSTRLARPCRIGDGVEVLEAEKQSFLQRIYQNQEFSRCAFVPASGAATRMFRDLMIWNEFPPETREDGNCAIERLLAEASRLPFWDEDEGEERSASDLIEEMLGESSLGLTRKPKGLLPFHRYESGSRSAFVEHLVEGAQYLKEEGRSRLHFTVSEEHVREFEAELALARETIEARQRTRYDVSFSVQDPSTSTLCLDAKGQLLRQDDGSPLLRPGGHGSLIANLQGTDTDVVFIKNIDNIAAESLHEVTSSWKQVLGGYLVWLRSRVYELVERLEGGADAEALREAKVFVERQLGVASTYEANGDASQAWVLNRLNRPLRVCGVVPNDGQAGGGPFWVPAADGTISAQIVESAQVQDDPSQQGVFSSGSHFNPVEMVCSLKDRHGKVFDLAGFVDLGASFIAEKSENGQPCRALEWPGLWNGSMAGWNTVFVEVPREIFCPVKTVFDLLEPMHQPALAGKARILAAG